MTNAKDRRPRSRIRERREQAGLSQQALAEAAGCSISTVRVAEAGGLPSERMLWRLAVALGCEPGGLLPERIERGSR